MGGEPVTTYDPPQPNAALVIGPDDYLVLSFHRGLTADVARELREHLLERFPAIADRVLIVNADQLASLRANPALAPAGLSAAPPPTPTG